MIRRIGTPVATSQGAFAITTGKMFLFLDAPPSQPRREALVKFLKSQEYVTGNKSCCGYPMGRGRSFATRSGGVVSL